MSKIDLIRNEIFNFLDQKVLEFSSIRNYSLSILDELSKFNKSHIYTELLELILQLFIKHKEVYIEDFIGKYIENNRELNSNLEQFFTPDNIVDFMWDLSLESYEDDGKDFIAILDPACGTGRFFISFYKKQFNNYLKTLENIEIKSENSDELEKEIKESFDKINPFKKNILFYSIDIDLSMFAINIIQSLIFSKIYPFTLSDKKIFHTVVFGNTLLGDFRDYYTISDGYLIKSEKFYNFLVESYKKGGLNEQINNRNKKNKKSTDSQKELFN
ncbi:MAG: hypothetical protein KatS3mg068_1561 [Candidatus Sericytochromatia bacterium]|nr:MAG: hypothetical protein KatS3mg068_1561 [Candidatus Sericytochromatia bacterium]